MEPTSTTIAAVAGVIKTYGATILGAALGAATNLKRSVGEQVTAVLAAIMFSLYVLPAVAEYFAIKSPAVLNGMQAVSALFALTLVRAVGSQIEPAIEALRKKFTGG